MTDEAASAYTYSVRAFFFVAVAFIFAAPVFWMRTEIQPGNVDAAYENADLYQKILPSYHFGFGRLRSEEMPLWNPKQLCGVPFQANPESALFQPLNLMFALFPVERALALHAFAALSLMGIFFVMFLRSLGIGYIPAIIGGVAYAFCGASAAAVSRPAMANALVWAPLAFWGLRNYFKTYSLSSIVVSGLGAALMVLSGATGLAFTMLAAMMVYAAFLTIFPGKPFLPQMERPPHLRRIEALSLWVGVVVAVSAVQWIPSLMWMASLEHRMMVLLPPELPGIMPNSFQETLAQFLVPKPGALPHIAYLGAIPLLALPAALFAKKNRADVFFFLGIGTLFLVLAGSGTKWISPSLPAGYLIYPAVLSISVVAAAGFDRLLEWGAVRPTQRPWLAVFSVAGAGALLFYVTTAEPRGRILAFMFLLLVALITRKRWMLISVGVAFSLLLFADLSAANRNMYRHPLESGGVNGHYLKTILTAEEQALDSRIIVSSRASDNNLPANIGMLFPAIYCADGLAPMTREQAAWWRRLGAPEQPAAGLAPHSGVSTEAAVPKLINHMCGRVIIAGPEGPMYSGIWQREGPALREIKSGELPRLFVNDDAMPRAYWVPGWRMSEGAADAADALGAAGHDPRLVCLVDHDSPGVPDLASMLPALPAGQTPPQPASGAACMLEDYAPERVAVKVSSAQPGITILADTYAPGWRAMVDDVATPMLRVNGLFRGVATPPGEHRVVFQYRPMPYYIGLAVSLASLTALTLTGLVAFCRKG